MFLSEYWNRFRQNNQQWRFTDVSPPDVTEWWQAAAMIDWCVKRLKLPPHLFYDAMTVSLWRKEKPADILKCSLSLFLSLPLPLSLFVSVCLFPFFFVSLVCVCLFLSVCLSVCLSVSLSAGTWVGSHLADVKIYTRYIESPVTMKCQRHQAVGNWHVCMDPPYTVRPPCLVYSFG